MEWRHQCGVHGKLRTPKKGQAINNDLQPTTITWIRCSNVQVTHHDVATLPPPHASCAMMAKGVKGTATSAEAGGQRQTETKAALEQHTEQVTLNPIEDMGRSSGESHSRSWATLRSKQGSLGSSHGGHDPHAEIPLTWNRSLMLPTCRVDPGSCSSGSLGGGRNPLANALQSGGSNPCTLVTAAFA